MEASEIQQQLFDFVKTRVAENVSVAEDVAQVLEISTDSAYRRIRAEKALSLDELYKLCTHYRVSLDQLMKIQTGAILFQGQYLDKKKFRFEEYMTNVMHSLAYMNSFEEKEFFYSCKDLPIYHHYHFREIAAFKWFFWLKTYFHFPEFERKKFRVADFPDELYVIDQKVLNLYNQIPSTELWNIESMNIFFRQIEFYRDGQVFESDKDALLLYETLEKLWNHLEEQAALGYKFTYGDPEKKPLGHYNMYFNEVLLGDNNQLVVIGGSKMAYVTHSTINFMMTTDVAFTENLYNHLQNQMKRSTLISEVSEKERSRFFRIIREKIAARKQSLKV